ncbi:hypothetical protein CEW46_32365 [Bacillus cereus]|nr:hypothetical protein CEW46_32365 [Bacillus cereus]
MLSDQEDLLWFVNNFSKVVTYPTYTDRIMLQDVGDIEAGEIVVIDKYHEELSQGVYVRRQDTPEVTLIPLDSFHPMINGTKYIRDNGTEYELILSQGMGVFFWMLAETEYNPGAGYYISTKDDGLWFTKHFTSRNSNFLFNNSRLSYDECFHYLDSFLVKYLVNHNPSSLVLI